MFIKNIIAKLAHNMTGRKCNSCTHNCGGRCCHPSGSMFMKCWHSITRPGYEYSESVHYFNTVVPEINDALQVINDALQKGMDTGLTEEEKYQLQKIAAAVQEAGEMARESGLLEEE